MEAHLTHEQNINNKIIKRTKIHTIEIDNSKIWENKITNGSTPCTTVRAMIPSKKVTISSLVQKKCNYFSMSCIRKELPQSIVVSNKIER